METTYKHSGKVRYNSHNYYLRDRSDWIPSQLDLRACTPQVTEHLGSH